MMMGNDKKKMAMMIIGKKDSSDDDYKNDDYKDEDYKDEDMDKDALEYCMKGFMKAMEHQDVEKALKLFKKLSYMVDMHMKDDNDEDMDY
jgi:hypothetical protein